MPKAKSTRVAPHRFDPIGIPDPYTVGIPDPDTIEDEEPLARPVRPRRNAQTRPRPRPPKTRPAATAPNPAMFEAEPHKWHYLVEVKVEFTKVSRILTLPADLRFDQLHRVLQIAFGWKEYHLHTFHFIRPDTWEEVLELQEDPEETIALAGDLYNGESYGNERHWTLADAFDGQEWSGSVNVMYEYDLGAGWDHKITVLARQLPSSWNGRPGNLRAACLGGYGHPIGEDSGGPHRWNELVKLYENPEAEDPEGKRWWYEYVCPNGDRNDLNVHQWDMEQVNQKLIAAGV